MSRSGIAKQGKLFYLMGLPRSGKSSLANYWINEQFEEGFRGNPRVVLGGDDFRQALTGREFLIEAEGTVMSMIDVAAKALLLRGFDVLIDETCTTEASLLRMYRIDIDAERILVDTSSEECIRRAELKNMNYLIGPIQRMAPQLEHMKANFENIKNKVRNYLINRRKDDINVN